MSTLCFIVYAMLWWTEHLKVFLIYTLIMKEKKTGNQVLNWL